MMNRIGAYTFKLFLGDCFGAFIAALIALPYGLAMATLMGLPPILGVFTSILTAPITAVLGKNPVLIGGTASATVPFIAFAVKQQGLGGAAKISLVASILMLVISTLKWGRYMQLVPQAVVTGFSCGIGGMMLISQFQAVGPHRDAILLVLLVILVAMATSRYSPRVPAPLIGVVVAVIAARLFGLHEQEVGALPLALPPFIGFSWSPSDVYTVLPSGLALALVSSVNILITSRVVDHFRGRHQHARKSDADGELGAYGIANIAAGMFAAPMSVGIPARSLASVRCGATTRLSNVLHGVFLLGFVTLGAGLVAKVPLPALAGVTAWMGICLLDWSAWRRLPKMRRIDAVAFFSTAIAVVTVNAVAAVLIGSSLYIVRWLYGRVRGGSEAPVASPQSA